MTTKKVHVSPKIVFLHLLMIAMLYIGVIASIVLFFQYVNHFFPSIDFDYIDPYYAIDTTTQLFRWSSSVLVIAFPVFLYTMYLIHKDLKNNPNHKDLRIRKWLLYLTQFLTAITLIVDLMVLAYQFFGGELTLNIFLKVLIVFVIAGSVLFYYRWELKQEKIESSVPKIIAVVVGVLLLVGVLAQMLVAGGPGLARDQKFDSKRNGDLQNISSALGVYYESNQKLPETLDELNEFSPYGLSLKDPESGERYEYEVVGEDSYKLCATFATEVSRNPDIVGNPVDESYLGLSYTHPKGYHCYEEIVDEIYKK